MAKANESRRNQIKPDIKTHEGGAAFSMGPELELYALVCTYLNEDKFYQDANDQTSRLRQLLDQVSNEFIGKLAVFARKKMNLRTAPVVLTVLLASKHNGDNFVRRVVRNVVNRADEIPEMLAAYKKFQPDNFKIVDASSGQKGLRSLSKQMVFGLQDAFLKFDEYQLRKYYGGSNEFNMRDALRLVRPKPDSDERAELWTRLRQGKDALKVAQTIETQMADAARGAVDEQSKAAAKRESLEQAIASKKIGYMATLRNLKNYIEAGISAKHVKMVCDFLTNTKAVANSKQFPYRFYTAYQMLSDSCGGKPYVADFLDAVERAAILSIDNLIDATGRSWHIGIDVSGSMGAQLSSKSVMSYRQVALVLGSLAVHVNSNSTASVFATTHRDITIPKRGMFEGIINNRIGNYHIGYGTNGHLVLESLLRKKAHHDDIILFSDMQFWARSYGTSGFYRLWDKYRSQVNADATLYLVDLTGYGRSPVSFNKSKNSFEIAGWSSEIFKIINDAARGINPLQHVYDTEIL